MSAVVEHVEQRVALASSPAQAVALAMERGDLEQVARFMDLQERYEANEARKAYNIAVAAFKAEAVTIIRARQTTDGPLKGRKYAELYSIINAVTPALSKHGLSTSWKLSKDDKDWMEVTCTLRHVAGHSESVSMGGAPDTGPGRNAIQARASTVTYLEKYTLKAILGVSDQGDDDDGRGAGKDKEIPPPPRMSAEAFEGWRADMTALADEGVTRLAEGWDRAGKELRKYVSSHFSSWWAELKVKAEKVDA
jgi:hypothetical protein